MIEQLEHIDRQLFLFLNGLNSPMMDIVMHYVSEGGFWIPIYLLILFAVYKKFGLKTFVLFGVGAGLTVLLSDRLSVELFKEVFQRYRPCHNLDIQSYVHTVYKCGGKFGFVSSHATNYFGVAVLTALFMKSNKITALLLFWAALIAYSRIYLGVHYPADIVGGAALGTLISIVVYRLVLILSDKTFPSFHSDYLLEQSNQDKP